MPSSRPSRSPSIAPLTLGLGLALLLPACGSEAPTPTPDESQFPADKPAFPPSRLKFDVGAIPSATPTADPTVPEQLRERLADAKAVGMPLRSFETVKAFYEQREYRPAWTVARRISAVGVDALRGLGQLPAHGLDPADYGTDALAPRGPDPRDAVAFDLLLTDGWLTAAAHLRGGRVRPEDLGASWSADGRADDLVAVLETALSDGNPREALLARAPSRPDYAARVKALAALQAKAEAAKKDETPASPTDASQMEALAADLERMRWLPREPGPRYVQADLGTRQLTLREGAEATLTVPFALSRRCAAIHGATGALSEVRLHPKSAALGPVVLHAGDPLQVHGAPADVPFSQEEDLRSGCIRLEAPERLAEALLKTDATWTPEAFAGAIAKGEPQTIALAAPIPLLMARSTVLVPGKVPVLLEGAKATNAALLKALRTSRPKPIRALPEAPEAPKTPKDKAPKPKKAP